MAFVYTPVTIDANGNITDLMPAGTVFRYAGVLLANTQSLTGIGGFHATTSSIKYGIDTGALTYVNPADAGTITNSTPDGVLEIQSGQADVTEPDVPPPPPTNSDSEVVTLTAKTVAGLTKAFTLIQEGRTRQLSAEQLLLVVKAAAEAKASINDTDLSATGSTLSASKINDLIVAAKAAVINQIYGSGVAPEALDQIVEIAQKLTDNDTEFGAFLNSLAGKLSFTEAQSLTTAQKATALDNIGAASTGYVDTAILAAVGDPALIDIDALANSIVTPFPAPLV